MHAHLWVQQVHRQGVGRLSLDVHSPVSGVLDASVLPCCHAGSPTRAGAAEEWAQTGGGWVGTWLQVGAGGSTQRKPRCTTTRLTARSRRAACPLCQPAQPSRRQ